MRIIITVVRGKRARVVRGRKKGGGILYAKEPEKYIKKRGEFHWDLWAVL